MMRVLRFRTAGAAVTVWLAALPAAAFAGADNPRLFFALDFGDDSASACARQSQQFTATVRLGPTDAVIAGAQFVVEYDPTCLDLVRIVPAGDPYPLVISSIVDEPSGWIFFAVGIELGGQGVRGDADLAMLTFEKTTECDACSLCFGGENPYNTYLTDDDGQPVLVAPECSAEVRPAGEPFVDVPSSVTAEVDCKTPRADVAWDPPQAAARCGAVEFACEGSHDSGLVFDDETVFNGGRMPRGLSTFCCTATGQCDETVAACWTVTVDDPLSFLDARTDPDEPDKNRFISLGVETNGRRAAIRVKLNSLYDETACPPRVEDLPDLSRFDGDYRWVGPPERVSEGDGEADSAFWAAPLQCCPYFADFSTLLSGGMLHVHGPEVVPCSQYEIQLVPECCADSPDDPDCLTPAVSAGTALWGDIWEPWGGSDQPSVVDVAKGVDAFRSLPYDPGPPPTGGPGRTRAMLRGNHLPLHTKVNVTDIGKAVDAFRGIGYGEAGPQPCDSPCP